MVEIDRTAITYASNKQNMIYVMCRWIIKLFLEEPFSFQPLFSVSQQISCRDLFKSSFVFSKWINDLKNLNITYFFSLITPLNHRWLIIKYWDLLKTQLSLCSEILWYLGALHESTRAKKRREACKVFVDVAVIDSSRTGARGMTAVLQHFEEILRWEEKENCGL